MEKPAYSPEQVRESALERMRLEIHNRIIQYLTLTKKIENKEEYRNEVLEIVEMVLAGSLRAREVDWRELKEEAKALTTGEMVDMDTIDE